MVSRRTALQVVGLSIGGMLVTGRLLGQVPISQQRPDPSTFQSGDFVWPKPPGTFIPYAGTSSGTALTDAQELTEDQWNRLRVEYIKAARSIPSSNPTAAYKRQVADAVEAMSYSRFYNQFAAGITPDEFQTYGFGQLLYVGHVAIIDVASDGTPYVVEGVYGTALTCISCVQRVPYADWLKARGDVYVWHGRLRDVSVADRAAVVGEAKRQAGKPYDFFNFDLGDDSGFYCSKLAWYSTRKATGIALDDDSNTRRIIWFSPLQMMRATTHIAILSSPGNYRNLR